MRSLMLRGVAVFALVLSPALAQAQGGPGGPGGPDRAAPGERGGGPGGGERGGSRQGGGGDNGARQGGGGGGERRGGGEGGERRGGNERGGPGGGGEERGPRGGQERGAQERGGPDRGDRGDRGNKGDRGDRVIERDRDRGDRVGPAGGGRARITVEERGRIRGFGRRLGGERLGGVDFRIGVGTRIPPRYRFNRLPPEILEIVPEYRGYDYIIVGNQILIIEPGTREIIDVLDY